VRVCVRMRACVCGITCTSFGLFFYYYFWLFVACCVFNFLYLFAYL
jgi:hypothetical protein